MFKIQIPIKSIVRILYLKALAEALDSTSVIKAKRLEVCIPCLLVQKVMASFYGDVDLLLSVNFLPA